MLAKELGMSLAQAQREIDSAEFAEWLAFYNLDPFGDRRQDYQAGVVAAAITNMLSGKGASKAEPEHFMKEWGNEKKQKQSPQEMRNLFEFYVSMHNRYVDHQRGKAS